MVDIHTDFAGGLGGQLILIGIAGSVLGSFLSSVIYRLPRRKSVFSHGFRCPSCGASIFFRDTIPIVSYILLRGKCRHCLTPISWQYPLIELLTALIAIVLYILNNSLINFIADTALGSILLTACAIDMRYMIIPDRLNAIGALLAVPFTFRWGTYGILHGVYGALFGIIVLAIMMLIGHLLFKQQGIGMGDVKLMVVVGLFLGPFWTCISFLIALLIGGIWGVITLVHGSVKPLQKVPFGPFIALGGFCVLFFKLPILFIVEHYLSLL